MHITFPWHVLLLLHMGFSGVQAFSVFGLKFYVLFGLSVKFAWCVCIGHYAWKRDIEPISIHICVCVCSSVRELVHESLYIKTSPQFSSFKIEFSHINMRCGVTFFYSSNIFGIYNVNDISFSLSFDFDAETSYSRSEWANERSLTRRKRRSHTPHRFAYTSALVVRFRAHIAFSGQAFVCDVMWWASMGNSQAQIFPCTLTARSSTKRWDEMKSE